MSTRRVHDRRGAQKSTSLFNRRGMGRRKEDKKFFWPIFFLVLGVSSLAGVFYLLRIPQIQIQSVRIDGVASVSVSDIQDVVWNAVSGSYVWIIPKTNILLVPRTQIETDILKKFPRIERVVTERTRQGELIITIYEREAESFLCDEKKIPWSCFFVDDQGFVFAPAPTFSETDKIIFTHEHKDPLVGEYILERDSWHMTKEMIEGLLSLGFTSTHVVVVTSERVHVGTEDGVYIAYNTTDQPRVLLDNLLSARDTLPPRDTLEYIDLRFENRVIFKKKDSSLPSETAL